MLVSVGELRALLVTSGAAADPGRPPPVARLDDTETAALRAELARMAGAFAVATAERDGARSTAEALRLALDVAGQRAGDLATALDVERARAAGLAAELAALRSERRLPWWRRLLPLPIADDGRGGGD